MSVSFGCERRGLVHELEADVGEVQGFAGVGEVDCGVHIERLACTGARDNAAAVSLSK